MKQAQVQAISQDLQHVVRENQTLTSELIKLQKQYSTILHLLKNGFWNQKTFCFCKGTNSWPQMHGTNSKSFPGWSRHAAVLS